MIYICWLETLLLLLVVGSQGNSFWVPGALNKDLNKTRRKGSAICPDLSREHESGLNILVT